MVWCIMAEGMTAQQMEPNAPQTNVEISTQQPSTITRLLCTKDWLNNELQQHQVVKAVSNSVGDKADGGTDPETITSQISQLKEELIEATTDLEQKELMLQRLQLSEKLMQILYPPKDEATTGESGDKPDYSHRQRDCLKALLDKQTELVSQILSVQKAITVTLKPSLEEVKRNNLQLKADNRELMSEVQSMRNSQGQLLKKTCSTEKVQRAENRVKQAMDKAEIACQVYQRLILASGIDVSKDDMLTHDLDVAGLGQPLDTQI